jgi:hypothetical protein
MDIAGVLRELKDTPLPTIFVVAGIAFLLLAVGVQLRGPITARQQKVAGAIGGALLLVGLGLFFVPGPRPAQPVSQPTTVTQPGIPPFAPSTAAAISAPSASASAVSSPTAPQVVVTPVTAVTTLSGAPTAPPNVTREDLNALFGDGNWFCFPDRQDGIGVQNLPPNFTVQSPLSYVDTRIDRFITGQVAQGIGGASAQLQRRLPRDQCPSEQQPVLDRWGANRHPIARELLDAALGVGNWHCTSDTPYAVKITALSANLLVQYPFTAIDDNSDGKKYGVGHVVPGGGEATAWIPQAVPKDQCP